LSREAQITATSSSTRSWPLLFTRNLVIWLVPVYLVWLVFTPFYNLVLMKGAEHLVRFSESPALTKLERFDTHHLIITRTSDDVPQLPYSVRTTDIHFHLIMLGAMFMAVPGLSRRERLENLGWACFVAVFFHIGDLFLWVKFAYATQLGTWSLEHYGPTARNVYGLAKHLLDLPFKLGLPLGLWGYFYVGDLMEQTGLNDNI